MQKIYMLFIAFAAILCVGASVSECDYSGALSCIHNAMELQGWLMEPIPDCSAWYNCIIQYKCTTEELDMPEPDDCRAIKSCATQDLENVYLVNDCYVEQRTCSGLRRCLDPLVCSELADWAHLLYCKNGNVKYCHAQIMLDAKRCIEMKGNQASCSALQGCLNATDNNCDLVLKNQLELPARCRTFPVNGANGPIASFLLTVTIIMAARIIAA